MDLKQIEKLMAAMTRMGMKRLVIRQEGVEVELERETPFVAVGAMLPHQFPQQQPNFQAPAQPEIASAPKKEGKAITSPMIGTFYGSPSPDSPSFVKVGDKVDANTVVCIVEAMKVMNEIKARVSGTITEVLVKNGEPVEFGSKLFRIE